MPSINSTTSNVVPDSSLTNLRVVLLELALRYPSALLRVPSAGNEAYPDRATALEDLAAYEAAIRRETGATPSTSPQTSSSSGLTVDEMEADRIRIEALPLDGTEKGLLGWDLGYRVEVLANIAYADPNETEEHRDAAVLELLRSALVMASDYVRATIRSEWSE